MESGWHEKDAPNNKVATEEKRAKKKKSKATILFSLISHNLAHPIYT